jgi:RNA polymerase sigma-70 factor (ECF subfamily)
MIKEQDQKQSIEWMRAYQAGKIEAFESLYAFLQPILFQYLLYKTFNLSLTEDLLQEAFLQLHRSRRTYIPGKPVLPWALAIARNVFLMNCRARSRRQKHEIFVGEYLPEAATTSPFDGIAERQTVRRALTQLTPDQREILLMHHALGLNFREIAGILGILRSTAKLRAHRAIKSLREILDKTGVTNERQEQIN